MKPFLSYVAEDIIAKYGTDLSRIAIVFPNKRASLFMNEYIARIADKPIWSPAYITISDLFRQHSNLTVGDPIKLICDLYKAYTEATGSAETLDHFYAWGQLMLSDFDDIDKNMADADKVFANLKDIHELDDVSYLTEQQKKALKLFFSNFSEDHNSELKKRFLTLWSNFGNIYHTFRKTLEGQGLAYEGQLYRAVAQDESIEFEYDKYLFVGFNMMQKVELMLCDRLRKEDRVGFYWDFDQYYIQNNEAGYYISHLLQKYKNELDVNQPDIYDNLSNIKHITYISANTENIQARYVAKWLEENQRYADGRKTAIVLCNENLLTNVIYNIPQDVKNVNITTGYPLAQSPVSSLVSLLFRLQTMGFDRRQERFRMHYALQILRHPYARYISDGSTEFAERLQKEKIYYISANISDSNEGLQQLFTSAILDVENQSHGILTWISRLLKTIGINSQDTDDAFLHESLFRMYTIVNRLIDLINAGDLTIDLTTCERLTQQLIQSTSVPFHGEPIEGLQLMGVLETRNLDFEHVLLLSCNEGNMPKGINDASFIPYSIRNAYGLTTIKHKVAIYSYYFHRIIQRAHDVTIMYNKSTEDGVANEMSQFMLQLMAESKLPIRRLQLKSEQETPLQQSMPVRKTKPIIDSLMGLQEISPSAINTYLRCQLQFYFKMILGIREPDENSEDIDNRAFGNIFHRSSELAYLQLADKESIGEQGGKTKIIQPITIHKADIDKLRKDKHRIKAIVDQAFSEEFFKNSNHKGSIHYNGLQLINREVIINYLGRLLEIDAQIAPFSILALEQKVSIKKTIMTAEGEKQLKIGGYIDRLDKVSVENGSQIRVVDYKTGSLPNQKINSIDEIFDDKNIHTKHSDYYLQTLLYSDIVRQEYDKNNIPVVPALLFIQHTKGNDYDPTLYIGKDKIADIAHFQQDFSTHLQGLLEEIFNVDEPLKPTSDYQRCKNCPYKDMCKS